MGAEVAEPTIMLFQVWWRQVRCAPAVGTAVEGKCGDGTTRQGESREGGESVKGPTLVGASRGEK
eukprot:scaffold9039_cov115-Isochrysis_galbana.AAC.4